MISGFDNIKDTLINEAPEVSKNYTKRYLREFTNLNLSLQHKTLNTLWLVFKEVLADIIIHEKELVLPYIGTLRIRPMRQMALDIREELAEKYGYSSYKLIPKDLYEEFEKEVRQILYDKVNVLRKQGIKYR